MLRCYYSVSFDFTRFDFTYFLMIHLNDYVITALHSGK